MMLKKRLFLLAALFLSGYGLFAQCAAPVNVYTFSHSGHSYQLVRENLTWVDAAACAQSKGGYLAEINDINEQNTVFAQLNANAGIDVNETIASDGGSKPYVWLGGNDMGTEGEWVWDGDNSGNGVQFWQGAVSGSPVGGLYNNWGNEPDNFTGQDGLGIGLSDWPNGNAGQWNDVKETNDLYFLIEYDMILEREDVLEYGIDVYPNPASNWIRLSSTQNLIASVKIFDLKGQLVHTQTPKTPAQDLEISLEEMPAGVFSLQIELANGEFAFSRLFKD